MELHAIDGWDRRLGGAYLVLGVSSRDFREQLLRERTPLVTIAHQAGGYACLHDEVTGVVMRLIDARHLALQPLDRLLNGFGLIAESNTPSGDDDDERLLSFGFTRGDAIDTEALSRIVSESLPVPRFDEGVEAFVSGPVDDPRIFARWSGWHPDLGCFPIDEAVNDHLVAAVAISGQPLRAFLLWENSD